MNSTKWFTLTEFVQHLSKTEEKLAEERRHKRDRAERVCPNLAFLPFRLCGELLLAMSLPHGASLPALRPTGSCWLLTAMPCFRWHWCRAGTPLSCTMKRPDPLGKARCLL